MINCRKATRLMSDKQERKLSPGERITLKIHLALCSACRNFGEQMSVLKTLSQQYVKGAPPGDKSIGPKSQEREKPESKN